jgi:hypothetical protein
MLKAVHKNYFLRDGFSCKHIAILEKSGVRSLDAAAALQLNLRYGAHPIAGIWFPYAIDYGQVRVDNPGIRIRYLSPQGSKSRAWKPTAAIITEGWKDAAAATLMGDIDTGAIPGICHYQSLGQNSQQVIIFDADGWTNPDIFTQLIKAGIWVNGKVQLVPQVAGNPKAGLLDWLLDLKLSCRPQLAAGAMQPEAYQALVGGAETPAAFLAGLPLRGQWAGIDREQRRRCMTQAMKLSRLFSTSNGLLIQNMSGIDPEFVRQLLSDRSAHRVGSDSLERGAITRPGLGSNLDMAVPIERCLCRDNQELLDRGGVTSSGEYRCNNPRLFRLATDLVGVASALAGIGQRYVGEPEVIFWDCAGGSALAAAEIRGIWKSANSKVRMPSVPMGKILDRIRYWGFTQS